MCSVWSRKLENVGFASRGRVASRSPDTDPVIGDISLTTDMTSTVIVDLKNNVVQG
jgi:hypothetical protein